MKFLEKKPFYLNIDQTGKIKEQLENLSVDEKIGQLFCVICTKDLASLTEKQIEENQIGGVMFTYEPASVLSEIIPRLQKKSKIPLLISGDLESGAGEMIAGEAFFHNQLGVAATNNREQAYRLGKSACHAAARLGINWTYSPVIDLNMNFKNPITSTRTFGSNKNQVIQFAKSYLSAAKEENVMATLKHFPGDGVDDRDQHLVTSVNSLSESQWWDTYGNVYSALIDRGAVSVMVGHIAQPNLVKASNPNASTREQYLPATLSKEIVKTVLREKLAFNGLVVTDASQMLGFTTAMPREEALPRAIENGIDMVLLAKDLNEDVSFIKKGLAKGTLSMTRLDEAVARILATKCLINEQKTEKIENTQLEEWRKEVADQSITLVKDEENLLPLNPDKNKRILLNYYGLNLKKTRKIAEKITDELGKSGFEVRLRSQHMKTSLTDPNVEVSKDNMKELFGEVLAGTSQLKETTDMAILLANYETRSGEVTNRMNFSMLGNEAPWYTGEIPTMLISFSSPYHLYDIPSVSTYVNAYGDFEHIVEATLEKIMGHSSFKGISPVEVTYDQLTKGIEDKGK